ncbi:MAG: ABC transporter permease [Clostridia bacterium]|nr:ABC transporter permease [Clostridia bacterium]
MEVFLASCIVAGTPLLFATLGEIITEKSGSLNLGVEGMMLMGAVIGFLTAAATNSALLAVLGAIAAGAAGALIFAILTASLNANQNVVGLTLTIFGTGFAGFLGQPVLGTSVPAEVYKSLKNFDIPLLKDIPFVGPVFFRHDVLVYVGYIVIIGFAFYMYKTRIGLNMRAVGENTAAADASGINVTLYKYVHIIIGGALAGLGGAYLSLVRVPVWQSDIVNGRGWIAVALVIFASWNPIKSFFGAVLFGGLGILGMKLQAMGFSISQYLVDMIPYVATIIIVIISTHKRKKESQPPHDLSVPYFREER